MIVRALSLNHIHFKKKKKHSRDRWKHDVGLNRRAVLFFFFDGIDYQAIQFPWAQKVAPWNNFAYMNGNWKLSNTFLLCNHRQSHGIIHSCYLFKASALFTATCVLLPCMFLGQYLHMISNLMSGCMGCCPLCFGP